MANQLDTLSGSETVDAVEIVGVYWGYPGRLTTNQGDLNMSAFGASWSSRAIVESALGLSTTVNVYNQTEIALEYCEGKSPWPSISGVGVVKNLGIVCLAVNQ
jgi:hypothetical protein